MRILSVARALPSRRVCNDELVERFRDRNRGSNSQVQVDALADFLRAQLEGAGAISRYHRAEDESALPFGVEAAVRAMDGAGLRPADIDLLIYTGVGRGFVEPATANVFQAELGLTRATCFDVLDACASWLRGIQVARSLLRDGSYRRAMILNCEFNFRDYEPSGITSLEELESLWAGYTVGEAATATILSDEPDPEDYHLSFRSAGDHAALCQIPLPQAGEYLNGAARPERAPLRFYSEPYELAKHAVKALHEHYWADPTLRKLSYDVVFGHSASVPLSRVVLRTLKLDAGRHVEVFPHYGNTVSAGLPIAVTLATEEGRLLRGDRVLFIMGGAGITTGFCTFVY